MLFHSTTQAIGSYHTSGAIKHDLIDGYIIDRPIGSGATSTVYLAYSRENPNKRFAVKFLTTFLAGNDETRARWDREVRILTDLSHTNIVRAFDHGFVEGRLFLIMEFLQGESLQDRLKRLGQLEEKEVLGILKETLAALSEANKSHVVHRDIKPANMIRLHDGTVKVMDFGLAKLTDGVDVTSTGAILGTPIYLSPEQATGEKNITIQSDLYSVGITAYHLLCGKPPFNNLNASLLLTRKITDDVPDIRHENSEISSKMAFFVAQLCARDLGQRPRTPEEALDLLDQLQSGTLTTTHYTLKKQSSSKVIEDITQEFDIDSSKLLTSISSDKEIDRKPVFVPKGKVLFYEDDESRQCYILVSGRIQILKSGKAITDISEPGSFVGEMSPLNQTPRSATVIAREDAVLLEISEEHFSSFFSRHPDMLMTLAKSLAARLQSTTSQLNESNLRLGLLSRHVKEMSATFTKKIS